MCGADTQHGTCGGDPVTDRTCVHRTPRRLRDLERQSQEHPIVQLGTLADSSHEAQLLTAEFNEVNRTKMQSGRRGYVRVLRCSARARSHLVLV